MPIVDGYTSTKMIRSSEKTHARPNLSPRAGLNGRIPIFAVSASLVERDREKYIDVGFDGWILKPIDFKRVGLLLEGIVEEQARIDALYQPGHWEQGGWFTKRQADIFTSDTTPSGETQEAKLMVAEPGSMDNSPAETPADVEDNVAVTDFAGVEDPVPRSAATI